MGMTRADKEQEIKTVSRMVGDADLVIVTRNKGLTMKDVTALRNDLRKNDAKYKVSKNTLVRRALDGTKFEGLKDIMVGPTALATSKDPIAAARVVYNFTKTNDKLEIVGGASTEGVLDLATIKYLATLPSLDGLRGKIVGLLQAPGAQLARLAQAYADKGAAGAPAAE
jgi:large subunit ribosomal protein L10